MKKIELDNFRCYDHLEIEFKKGINLLIGDNGGGKTSLLQACKYVLSSFFSGFSDENTKWISPGNEDFRVIVDKRGYQHSDLPVKILFSLDRDEFPLSEGEAFFSIEKRSRKNSRALAAGLKAYRDYAKSLQNVSPIRLEAPEALPLFSYFSTEDIHTSRKNSDSRNRFKAYNLKRSFGYYDCLSGGGFFADWIKRLLVLEEAQKGQVEMDIVRDSVLRVLGQGGCNIICGMEVRPQVGGVFFHFTDGREVEVALLSDGYKRLVYLVTDIAFRAAILNGSIYGREAPLKTRGTVLIDEVDLHLHPKLQATVVRGLRSAFPKLQFIITTHAPMVMSGVKTEEDSIVYQLAYSNESGYSFRVATTYGMDLSSISEVVLGQTPRDQVTEDLLERLFRYIDDGEEQKARVLLRDMQQIYGDSLPEMAKAEAMLSFFLINDEEDN